MTDALITFVGIIVILSLCFIMGFLTNEAISDERVLFLTGEVQEQYWEIEKLELELQRCEYNAGNTQTVYLRVAEWKR